MNIKSIIICKHGALGYSASLRFADSTNDQELAHINKERLHSMINYAVRTITI